MKRVKLNINGREVEAILVERVYTFKRRGKIHNKVYEWEECRLMTFLPKSFAGKKVVVIKAEDLGL